MRSKPKTVWREAVVVVCALLLEEGGSLGRRERPLSAVRWSHRSPSPTQNLIMSFRQRSPLGGRTHNRYVPRPGCSGPPQGWEVSLDTLWVAGTFPMGGREGCRGWGQGWRTPWNQGLLGFPKTELQACVPLRASLKGPASLVSHSGSHHHLILWQGVPQTILIAIAPWPDQRPD